MTEKQDIYTRVTNKIIADLEKGEHTWLKPWNADHLAGRIAKPQRVSGDYYQGLNIILLWAASVESGFTSNRWMTFKQAKELGGHVMKGMKGETVIYASTMQKSETGEDGTETDVAIPFMKSYTVFNTEQIDGLPEAFYDKPEPVSPDLVARCDAGSILCRDRGDYPAWRQSGLLQHQFGLRADAVSGMLHRFRELLRHAGA